MSYRFLLATRYLFAKRSEKFIWVTTAFSIFGVAVGVMALIVVLGLMSGFEDTLKEKIISVRPHIVIEPHTGVIDMASVTTALAAQEDITAFSPYVRGQGMIKKGDYAYGVMIWGVDPVRESQVTRLESFITIGTLKELTPGSVFIGAQLARQMGLFTGDTIELFSPFKKKPHQVKVQGIFSAGMSLYDMNLVVTSLAEAQDFFRVPGRVSGIGLKLTHPDRAQTVAHTLRSIFFGYRVTTWMDENKNLFTAIALEKFLTFLVLTLIVLVSGFNIVSTLVMMVMEKTKDVGILRALGVQRGSIALIFLIKGIIIGCCGTALGLAGGLGITWFLEHYPVPLPQTFRTVYFTDHIPIVLDMNYVIIITVAAFCVTLAAAVYPALKASSLNTVDALRYE